MAGALMQLVAYGAQDVYLTGNPQITFFKVVYRRHTNFAMESMEQVVEGDVNIGSRLTCKIARNGDLVGRTYVHFHVAADAGGNRKCNRLGFALLNNVELRIGGQLVDRQSGTWMNVWTELTHTSDQKRLLDVMVGDSTVGRRINLVPAHTALNTVPAVQQTANVDTTLPLTVPLQFSFCRNPGLALPLVALQYHEIELVLQLAPNAASISKDTGNEYAVGNAFDCTLFCDYIFLDTEERKTFAQNPHEYLIETVQSVSASLTGTNANSVRLPFNHPVKELVWVAKNNTQNDGNGSDNFSNYSVATAGTNVNSLTNGLLRLNGQNRFSQRDATFFTDVQPYQHHTGCPSTGINCYSFALKPEEHQPSGTCNFSRVDNAELVVTPAATGDVTAVTNITVFAHGYNVLRVASGMGGLAYSN
jgi:hypothetical protein